MRDQYCGHKHHNKVIFSSSADQRFSRFRLISNLLNSAENSAF